MYEFRGSAFEQVGSALPACYTDFINFGLDRSLVVGGDMSQVIGQIGSTNFAVVGLGLHDSQIGSVRQQVHDGDTLIVRAEGNLSVRMLGIDAAEISFSLLGSSTFTPVLLLCLPAFMIITVLKAAEQFFLA